MFCIKAKLGDNTKALAHYEKALAMDPYMESAQAMIKTLKVKK